MTIYVTATDSDRRCVLWERNPEHPGGECFIVADERAYEVAETPLVLDYLRTGRLARVQSPAPEEVAPLQQLNEEDAASGEGEETGQSEGEGEGGEEPVEAKAPKKAPKAPEKPPQS